MSCDFAHDDAAYVLGALSPADRLAFERHLPGCADCTRAVRELAGLPGLLSRVDPGVLEDRDEELPPVPPTALSGLVVAARRARRRRTAVVAGAAAAAAALVTSLTASQLVTDDPPPGAAPPSAVDPEASSQVMAPVGDVPVQADLALQHVTWGTKLELTCTYDTASVPYALPPAVDYVLVVRTRDGHVERVGSWRSVDGRTMQLTAGTAATPRQIRSVRVRTLDGRVVLTASV
jgi:hypothetical protein